MALVHADNFSRYGTDETFLLNGVYAQDDYAILSTDPDGISGGYVCRISFSSGSSIGTLRYILNATNNVVGVASRLWLGSLPGSTSERPVPVVFCDATNSGIAYIQITTTGRIEAYSGNISYNSGGTLIGTTTNPVVSANGWYHIETKVLRDAAAGTLEVRVEGVTVLTLTGLTLGANDIAQIRMHNDPDSTGAGVAAYFKDLVVWDDSGTYNTDFLGSVLVTGLSVTSDVSLNWTPSSGATGYEILDNVPPVDATYISAGDPPPSPYVGGLSNLPADVTSVKGLITYVRAAKSDGGDGSLQVGLISDPAGTPTTVLGTDRPITVAQTYWMDVFETDPETSAPWLPAAVDLVQIQIDRTT